MAQKTRTGPEMSTSPMLCLFGTNCKIAGCTKIHSTLGRSTSKNSTRAAERSTDAEQEGSLGGSSLAEHQRISATQSTVSDASTKDTPQLGGAEEILEKMADAETQDAQIAIDRARNSAQETILKAERPLAQLRGTVKVSDQVRALEAKIEKLKNSDLVQKTPTQWREYTAQQARRHLERYNDTTKEHACSSTQDSD